MEVRGKWKEARNEMEKREKEIVVRGRGGGERRSGKDRAKKKIAVAD